ncbi:MAG TPA: bifunctional phosphoribosyl-AMP cyclohydrolase/phosphoribosyl-ATP diphosphatase HisIE [Allosphingosinicella sp.]|jgi:phosphoribosyl-ATP pyrophosphohydrolase/phosphoribosyl-AMP cyclohydrolase|nr:bifunctional phosphoribosyl-AMP cyclohydrolase/phosphoribosyl-ATP diphosphatase HisIE [Allosphingosinicella sp.]
MRDRNAPLSAQDIDSLAWEKMDGLLPAVAQDSSTGRVLMLGYMSREALAATLARGRAVFHSRSKGRLWEKGETSGNFLAVRAIFADCDGDSLVVEAEPMGPTCHLGTQSCFVGTADGAGFLGALRRIVAGRAASDPAESYTARLLAAGPAGIAQKIGEEGVELALAAVGRDRQGCVEETADLLYHVTVLMEARGFGWDEVAATLKRRHRA